MTKPKNAPRATDPNAATGISLGKLQEAHRRATLALDRSRSELRRAELAHDRAKQRFTEACEALHNATRSVLS